MRKSSTLANGKIYAFENNEATVPQCEMGKRALIIVVIIAFIVVVVFVVDGGGCEKINTTMAENTNKQ